SELVILAVGEGVLNLSPGGTPVSVVPNSPRTIALIGTAAAINALLNTDATSTFSYIDNNPTPPASTTLTVLIDDNGHTGSGGAITVTTSTPINITAVNNAPTALMTTDPYAATEQTTLNLKGTGMSVADADSLGASEQITVSVGEGTLSATTGDSGVS